MCGEMLASAIPCTCSCSSVKLKEMDKKKNIYKVTSPVQDIPTATNSQPSIHLQKLSHPKSLYSIRRQISSARTRPYRLQTASVRSKHLSALPGENNEAGIEQPTTTPTSTANHTHFYLEQEHSSLESSLNSDNEDTQVSPTTCTGEAAVLRLTKPKCKLQTILLASVPDERLSQTVAERSENDYYKPLPLEPDSSDSIVNIESIYLEEDENDDVGPEAVAIVDGLTSNSTTKKIIFREHKGIPRSHSMSEAHRRVHVLDELLISIDLEYGSSDTGPEPEHLLDKLPDSSTATSTESTEDHITTTKHRNSDSEAIIESLFAPKLRHSCCKNRRKSSWNAETRRKSSGQVNVAPRHRPRKIVVIGDMCSGKSSLISAYCKDRFNETYVPTILRSCLTDATVHGEKVELVVIEVSGREDYAKLRKCAYRKTDAVILCYSCDNASSFQKIKTRWLPEIRENIPNVPLVLVGTRKDIRDEFLDELREITPEDRAQRDIKSRIITESEGYDMSKSIGAQCFLECSARYRDGTRYVFETVTKVALQKSRRKKKMQRTGDVCSIM